MTTKSDIFSFGLILAEMFTCEHPFAGRTHEETVSNIKNRRMKPLPASVPDEIKTMILSSLNMVYLYSITHLIIYYFNYLLIYLFIG